MAAFVGCLIFANLLDSSKGGVNDHDGSVMEEEDADCAHTPPPKDDPLKSVPHDIHERPHLLLLPDSQRYVYVGTVAAAQKIEAGDSVVVRNIVNEAFAFQTVGTVAVAV